MTTVIVFATFIGIVWWAYAPSRKQAWERKALLLDDEQTGLSLISDSPSRHD